MLVQFADDEKIATLYDEYRKAKEALRQALQDEGQLKANPADSGN